MDRLCSAELLYRKFLVPCDPKAVIDQDYGEKNWALPITDGSHKFLNLKFVGKMDDSEWKKSVKFYNGKGFDSIYTLEFINKYADKKITAIDEDD